jgi:hypothetical protein
MKRFALVLVALVGCKKAATQEPVTTGSGSGSAVVVAPPPIDAATLDAPAPDAPPAGITIGKDGLSVMPSYNRKGKSDEETVADIQTKLPDLKVSFEVMEYADEREEGYYSAKKGDEEVVQFFRTETDGVDVRVTGPMFATAEGIKPGDKLSALIANRADVTCEAHDKSELGLLQCKSAGLPGLVFVLNAETYKGKQSGKLAVDKLVDRPIYMIAAGT